jgi:hypothetical protein
MYIHIACGTGMMQVRYVEPVFLTCLIVVAYDCELTSIMEFVQVRIARVLLC